MTNAWSLLYDEMKHSKYYYEYDRNDLHRKKPEMMNCDGYSYNISTSTESDYQDFWENEDNSMTGNPFIAAGPVNDGLFGAAGEDHITFTSNYSSESSTPSLPKLPTNDNGRWKYHEDVILKEIQEYLGGTYNAHYASPESKTQTLDLIEGIGDAEPFCRSNAIKYLSRFGKKNGKSKQDILKAIHYCILLYHFAGLCNENSTPYETF